MVSEGLAPGHRTSGRKESSVGTGSFPSISLNPCSPVGDGWFSLVLQMSSLSSLNPGLEDLATVLYRE